jgi:HEAT repeat protein
VVVSGGEDRASEVAGLLRQLWLGLAAYRLFPGSPDRPGFVAAVERIGESVRSTLLAGPIDVEVRSEGFVLAGTPLPPNESTERLARACFERRVERVAIGAVPDVRDLERTFAVLSMPPDDLRGQGGAEEMLASAGVGSIVLSALGPSAVEGADHEAEDVVANPARVPDAHLLASQLRIDDLAGYLTATERDDVRTMQAILPRTDEQRQASALLALRDYLTLEGDDERLGEVLSLWAEGLQRAIGRRDPVRVRKLLDPVREALGGAGDERQSIYGAYARQALAPEAVLALMDTARAEDGGATVPEVLEPFGDLGVEVLLDLLAEADRERRAHLLAALRQVARGHLRPVVARLNDPRWYVVRNAANLLGNAGGEEVLDQLAGAARHPSAQVRKEAVKALVVAGGVKAVPHLRTLAGEGPQDVRPTAVSVLGAIFAPEAAAALGDIARSSADRGLRRQALEELAEGAEGREVLRLLSDGHIRPRLSWKLRRHARRLLRDAREAAA